jgi:hypothetical protein
MTIHYLNSPAVTAAAARAAEATLSPATDQPSRALTSPEYNVSALAREHGVHRRTITRWLANGWTPPAVATIKIVEQDQGVRTPAHPPARHPILGVTCGALGLALAGVGLVVNAQYAAGLGHSMGESALLATLGLAVDAGAVILLSVAAALWQSRHPLWSAFAFVSWLGFTAASMIATAGFTSTAIGDHAAGRTAVIEQSMDLRTQRAETIAAAKAAVANAVTARDQECGKVGENCRKRVAELAQREAELRTAVAAPTVATASVSAADPGAKLISELAGISEVSVQKLRIGVLTVAPATAGLFLTFSVMLLGRRRGGGA